MHSLSCGAGVQSSTVALMAAEGELLPMPLAGFFADTQAEPAKVYKWLSWLIRQLPFPIHTPSAGNLYQDSLVLRRSKKSGKIYQKNLIPLFMLGKEGEKGILNRRCTAEYKVRQITKGARLLVSHQMRAWRRVHKAALRELSVYEEAAKEARKKKIPPPTYPLAAWEECQSDPLVIQWIGISSDEAIRMKQSRDPWVKNRWPLIELGMSRQDCLAWMEQHGYPKPPRSACTFCPYHSDAEWLRLKTEDPADFEKAVQFEKLIQIGSAKDEVMNGTPFLHSQRIPLSQVVFDPTKGKHQFGNECEGMCGV